MNFKNYEQNKKQQQIEIDYCSLHGIYEISLNTNNFFFQISNDGDSTIKFLILLYSWSEENYIKILK